MEESVEGGASLAWRLLATLEGGSFLLASSALLAYSARKRLLRSRKVRRPIHTVLMTNTTTSLGKELKTELEANGCTVRTPPVDSPAGREFEGPLVDALIVVGADMPTKPSGLQAMADLVSEDLYNNLKSLESLSRGVRRGGAVAWARGRRGGGYADAAEAFDRVLQHNLQRVATLHKCEAMWGGRELAATLLNRIPDDNFSFRNAANAVGEYIGRCLKIVT